jgi:light-regulated signal transduction histidine kinase (bacteriophytochrome)
VASSPAFGQADLTNCERELIHLAGSIQPHGLLLVISPTGGGRVVQCSATAAEHLKIPLAALGGMPLVEIGGDLAEAVHRVLADAPVDEPRPLQCRAGRGRAPARFDGAAHRTAAGAWVVELEPLEPPAAGALPAAFDLPRRQLQEQLSDAMQRISEAATIGAMADVVVKKVRDLVGYDRVMVYKFDPDGHGKIIAEARDPRLDSLLGHHYPASDIPQRARELYLRNRLRVLCDVDYEPSPLVPRETPADEGLPGGELDMSMCYLRSMSPLHLQYLRNMGVTATLVVSLVRHGRLWGLIACHHYRPRNLRYALRAACELLGEVISTRIAAIENYARAQVAIQVRRLQQRLMEATSTEGDWRLALLRNPRTLLHPLDATGAALFHGGEVLTAGEVPSTPELRALVRWIDQQPPMRPADAPPDSGVSTVAYATSSIGRANAALESLTPTASGVLAVRLSQQQPDYLMWLRKEQLQTVTWAGDPSKPVIDNDPLKLSPRRSFAAWSEIVRGTALPWSSGELAMAEALGAALVDIVVQVNAVRLLIAAHQLAQVRTTIAASREAVAVIGSVDGVFHANGAYHALAGRSPDTYKSLETLLEGFDEPAMARRMIEHVRSEQRSWRGELALRLPDGQPRPVAARAEPVPARDGSQLGLILILEDLTDARRAASARQQLEGSLERAGRALMPGSAADPGGLMRAILTNASLAAMDIADGGATAAPLLQEVEWATTRAAELLERIGKFASDDGR